MKARSIQMRCGVRFRWRWCCGPVHKAAGSIDSGPFDGCGTEYTAAKARSTLDRTNDTISSARQASGAIIDEASPLTMKGQEMKPNAGEFGLPSFMDQGLVQGLVQGFKQYVRNREWSTPSGPSPLQTSVWKCQRLNVRTRYEEFYR